MEILYFLESLRKLIAEEKAKPFSAYTRGHIKGLSEAFTLANNLRLVAISEQRGTVEKI